MNECLCVTVHRPALTRTIPLKVGGNTFHLCPTTYQAVTDLKKLYRQHRGTPPWELRRPFPEYARRIAASAWG